MNYFVKRGDQEYGPYTLADLQAYVQQGNISPTDIVRSEGMAEWAPVSSVIGTISVPSAATGFGAVAVPAREYVNLPPNLHWALLLVLSIVTCGIFGLVWLCIQAAWVRKIRPNNMALFMVLGHLGLSFAAGMFLGFGRHDTVLPLVMRIAGAVLYIMGAFSVKGAMEDYFSREENIGMQLSGVMTFFFSYIYFQYHFNEIRERRVAAGVPA